MNDDDLKTMEQWLDAERIAKNAAKRAKRPGATQADIDNAIAKFSEALAAAGKAFDMLRRVFGMEVPTPQAHAVAG